ncbi:MAG: glycosyltransferase [bacterium]
MKKNIAIIITKLELGGAQKVVLELVAGLDKKKFNVHLLCGPEGRLDIEANKIKDIELVYIEELCTSIKLVSDLVAYLKIISYLEKNKIDIVHTHSSKAGFLGRLAAIAAKNKPVIVHTVHGFPFHEYQNPIVHLFYVLLEKFVGTFTKKLIAVGSDIVEYGIKNGVGNIEKYEVIRAAIDVASFKNAKVDKKKYIEKFGLKVGVFTVGMIGNMKKQKNPFGFIEIARLALEKNRKLQFLFAGDGPLMGKMQKRVIKYNLENKIKLVGWINEPELFLKSIDVFLLTSLWEGLPCTLVQAAATGVPSIASGIGGNREFIKLASSGTLYSPFDYSSAADTVIKVAEKKAKTNIEVSVLKDFDIKYMVKQHENLYLTNTNMKKKH